MCDIKPGIGLIEVFSVHFLVLTSTGQLYILKNIYSDTINPIKCMDISSGDYIVTSNRLIISLDSRSTGTKTLVRLQDHTELASWLRVIADYGLDANTTDSFVPNVAPVTLMDKMKASPKQRQVQQKVIVQENVHAVGSGYTEDDLNSFGI